MELDRRRAKVARSKFRKQSGVSIVREDFLTASAGSFDFAIGNPPYVAITRLSERAKASYRGRYATARGRFDLYMLFFEQALRLLKPGGRLVFITPEKYLWVQSGLGLRRLLGSFAVREVRLLDEDTFAPLITYPAITVIDKRPPNGRTRLVRRDGTQELIHFHEDGRAILPQLHGPQPEDTAAGPVLSDVCVRISCGVATGADGVFVRRKTDLDDGLGQFAFATISGRQLIPDASPSVRDVMLVPYDRGGCLLDASQLGSLGSYLAPKKQRLSSRTCAARKPWYAFHDSVPLPDILRPKLLWKDIASEPNFWIDAEGEIVPRHSVYYLVPRDPAQLQAIAEYLRSQTAREWMRAHCQRAANGFIRLQSNVLKNLPVPRQLLSANEAA